MNRKKVGTVPYATSLSGKIQPRIELSKSCVPTGQPLLLPLTSSLYVAGTLASTDSVLIDIGTGYYMEVGTSFLLTPDCHVDG